jgi:hypothetical protein
MKVEAVAGIILVRDTFNPLHRAKMPSFCTISLIRAFNPLLLVLLLLLLFIDDVNELFPIKYNISYEPFPIIMIIVMIIIIVSIIIPIIITIILIIIIDILHRGN